MSRFSVCWLPPCDDQKPKFVVRWSLWNRHPAPPRPKRLRCPASSAPRVSAAANLELMDTVSRSSISPPGTSRWGGRRQNSSLRIQSSRLPRLAYYYDYGHKQEIDADIEESRRFVEELKALSPPLLAQKIEELRAKNPLLGLFADEPDLVDEVVESAMRDRETRPLRLPADGSMPP